MDRNYLEWTASNDVDGFHAKIYLLHWDVVGPSVCTMVYRVLEGQLIDPPLN